MQTKEKIMLDKIQFSINMNINTLERIDTNKLSKEKLVELVQLTLENFNAIKQYIKENKE